MKARHVVGGVIAAGFLIWGASAFLETTVQYVSIEDAAASTRVVQVLGKVDVDSIKFNADSSRLEFAVYDSDAVDTASARRLRVIYYGVVPGNLRQASAVVLKGKPGDDGIFVAERMLVKCPSKYQGSGSEEYQDIRRHEEGVSTSGV